MGASVAMHSGDDAISAYRGLSFASSNVSSFAHQAGAISTISKPLASSFTTISPLSKTAQVSMPSRSILTMPFGCFVAGTPVLSAEGERPIEALRVGERVLTPQSKDDDGTAVVPETWRKVGLEVAHEDGSKVELELLRPLTWIIEHDCKTGSRIWLEMDELGVKGWANVISVEACPQIASGKGRVILATMQRVHPQVVALALADDSELEATANHPLYSLTRNDWTAAGELQEGEILATADGSTTVRALSFLPGEHRVFNLEVESDHCYFTGHARVLSHNTCAAAKTGGRVLLDSNVTTGLKADATLGGRILPGEVGVKSYVTIPEMRNAVTHGNLRGVPGAAYDLPTLTTQPSLNARINLRGMLPDRPGRFGDGIIGAQALENNIPLITNDKALKAAVEALGGTTR